MLEDVLREERGAAFSKRTIGQLVEELKRLPRAVDGAFIYPGQTLYFVHKTAVFSAVVLYAKSLDVVMSSADGQHIKPRTKLYSTHELADKSLKK